MKLVACPDCHTQYDVSPLPEGEAFECRCGRDLEASAPKGSDARVQRCSACGALAREADEHCDYCGAEVVAQPLAGSLICPECFARNAEDARFCLACGVGFEPETIRSQRSELRCPGCERFLIVRSVGGLDVEECGRCHGLWVPEKRFEELVDRATRRARERAEQGVEIAPRVDGGNPASSRVEYRRCPECETQMNRRNYRRSSGVIVDQCHEHGTWLDAHELESIAGFVLSGRAARAEQLAAAHRDAREREAARAAMLRMSLPDGAQNAAPTIFTTRRSKGRGTVETIVDLLQTLFT